MSKLVEILALELEEWPEGAECIVQDYDGVAISNQYRAAAIVTREMWEAERAKVQVQQWNGEGLPPIGTVCEVQSDDGEGPWFECLVVAHHADKAVFYSDYWTASSDYDAFGSERFRPIKSDREKWIDAARNATAAAPGSVTYYEAIYDAGLAKLPD